MTHSATNGRRRVYSLISLTPGTSAAGRFGTNACGRRCDVSFNGMRESHNLYLLDGSEGETEAARAVETTSCLPSMPSPSWNR